MKTDPKTEMNASSDEITLRMIARIRTDFPEKFGVPRQSGLLDNRARIVFEPDFRNEDMFRGIKQYSHLWLIWGFSEHFGAGWHPTVRPPKLGGNTRIGVFATRSPFRPNPLGLSSVKLLDLEISAEEGPVLIVSGADMMDMTPIYDIKPYIPYSDAHPEAASGFAGKHRDDRLEVVFAKDAAAALPEREEREALSKVLSVDPRPAYQDDPQRIYKMSWRNMEIAFRVEDNKVIVLEILQKSMCF